MTARPLAESRFLLIGAGGLGGPVAYAMAAASAGRLVLVDPDLVELSNLQRQVQYATRDLGRTKVAALADELVRRGYPASRLELHAERLTDANAGRLLNDVDVAVEGSDDPATKFALNDHACRLGVRFAIGGVERWQGHVLAVTPGQSGCYRCLFEAPPAPDQAPSCAALGVVGAAVAVIGGLLAQEALSLAQQASPGPGPSGQLLVVEDVASQQPARRVRYNPRIGCPACPS